MERPVDLHSPGWIPVYRRMRDPHYLQFWLYRLRGVGSESLRAFWTSWHQPISQPRGIQQSARGYDDWPDRLLSPGWSGYSSARPGVSQPGLLLVQAIPHLREHAPGIPQRGLQFPEPSEFLE